MEIAQEIVLFLGLIPVAVSVVRVPVFWLNLKETDRLLGFDTGVSIAAALMIGQYFIF